MASAKQLVALVVPEDSAERLLELAEREPTPLEPSRRAPTVGSLIPLAIGLALGGAAALLASARAERRRGASHAEPAAESTPRSYMPPDTDADNA
jgi:hypothetical protein